MDNINLVLCVVLVIILLYQMKNKIDPFLATRKECNPSDGRCYKVSTKYNKNTHQEASLLLAALNKFSVNFMKHLRNKFLWERNGTPAQQDIVLFLLNNYNPDSIIENAPDSDINTSYVEDKGKVFAICLREKESGENKFIPIHELEFVVIHEMTHLGTRTIGHSGEILNFYYKKRMIWVFIYRLTTKINLSDTVVCLLIIVHFLILLFLTHKVYIEY
jgi:hypothetical protein